MKNFIIFTMFFGGMLIFPKYGTGQNFNYDNLDLLEVDFSAPSGFSNYKIPITKDDNSGLIPGPAWVSGGVKNPVAFVSGKAARVTAKFTKCSATMWAKGDGPGSYDLPAKQLVTSGATANYPLTAFSSAFTTNMVDFYDYFDITWYVSNSSAGPWIEVGKSNNPLYVTHKAPILTGVTKAFHTLLYLGCKNAKGLTVNTAIADAMYSEFTDQSVTKVGGTSPMTYWGPANAPQPACWATAGLLQYNDGRCGAWAEFFNDMIKVQGITGSAVSEVKWASNYALNTAQITQLNTDAVAFFGPEISSVTVYTYDQNDDGIVDGPNADFYVKDWAFGSSKFYLKNQFCSGISFPIGNGHILACADEIGVAGQGNVDPRSIFTNHGIVKYNNKYYDPSYGSPTQPDGSAWTNASIDGAGCSSIVYQYNLFGTVYDFEIVWYTTASPSLIFNP